MTHSRREFELQLYDAPKPQLQTAIPIRRPGELDAELRASILKTIGQHASSAMLDVQIDNLARAIEDQEAKTRQLLAEQSLQSVTTVPGTQVVFVAGINVAAGDTLTSGAPGSPDIGIAMNNAKAGEHVTVKLGSQQVQVTPLTQAHAESLRATMDAEETSTALAARLATIMDQVSGVKVQSDDQGNITIVQDDDEW